MANANRYAVQVKGFVQHKPPTMQRLRREALGFRAGILGSRAPRAMCFAVCWPLQGYLSAMGVEARLSKGTVGEWEHYWLTLPNGFILDPTADQFDGMPPVYIGPRPEHYKDDQGELL